MDEFENQSGASDVSETEELRGELQVVRMLMTVALLMLIGLSICADYYLSRQTTGIKGEATQMQTVADNFPQAAANDFVNRLKEYSKTHPDFAWVTTKYAGVFSQQTTAAPKK